MIAITTNSSMSVKPLRIREDVRKGFNLRAKQGISEGEFLRCTLGVSRGQEVISEIEEPMTHSFSPDYFIARQRFRESISRHGWTLESHPIDARGPHGEELTIDVALSSNVTSDRTLVISGGLHGVEGFFGSAVQSGVLERWPAPTVRIVLLHGLNPHGFAWLRRFDENNVDPNRNFLLTNESYSGSPDGYARLDALLNPKFAPVWWEPFSLKLLWELLRRGMPALKQTVAAGQYEFPRGLFFGGFGPSQTHHILEANFARWLNGCDDVVHLDFHTGLGRWGEYKLLMDEPIDERQRLWMMRWFGEDVYQVSDSQGIAYDARGGFGKWCVARSFAKRYLFTTAEFGTYSPLTMLTGLRVENQAHQWSEPHSRVNIRTKNRLRELFVPSSSRWRKAVLDRSFDLIERAIRGLRADENRADLL